jgi:hypothetical protein
MALVSASSSAKTVGAKPINRENADMQKIFLTIKQ